MTTEAPVPRGDRVAARGGPGGAGTVTAQFQLFDALPAHIEAALRASIERFGVLVPVSVDQDGNILDGHHRKRIADELKVPYARLVRVCADDDERREIARTLNADRRQLSEEQQLSFVAKWRSAGKSLRDVGQMLADVSGDYDKPVHPQQVQRMLERASTVTDVTVPESVRGLDGKVRPSRRPQVIARDDREQERAQDALELISDEAPAGTLNIREARLLAAREREPEPVPERIAPPAGKFRCIVVDPPWPMQKIEREERPDQGAALDYPTMAVWCTQSPACFHDAMDGYEPCQSIECVVGNVVQWSALDDCHIYLWVTHKYLPDGLKLLQSWGFNYQCVMTWRKNVGITPFSWMYDTEHVLFGRRGDLKLERLGLRLSFEAPVQGHSVKPDIFYERVIEATPGPRIDMFARRERAGFEAWGNEIREGHTNGGVLQ